MAKTKRQKMNKKYYFLAGLPRSGNTLLSSILNQNTDIYTSTISPVCQYMWVCNKERLYHQSSLISNRDDASIRTISKILENYYSDIKKPIIIDRDKNWAHPSNLDMLKTYFNKPKIIVTTRPILEVLASFIAIDKEGLIDTMGKKRYPINSRLSIEDNICDFLMNPTEQILRFLKFTESIDNENNKDLIHVIKYEDLVNTPNDVMNSLYSFLNIDNFVHDFKNIKQLDRHNDEIVGLPKNMHKVRKVLKRSKVKVENYLSDYAIEKYKDIRYF